MLAQNGGANQKYKAKLRSLAFNLRDANNPDLRRRVLSAEVSGKRTACPEACHRHCSQCPVPEKWLFRKLERCSMVLCRCAALGWA